MVDESLMEIKNSNEKDFILSRGEYLSALIMAEYLAFDFLDAKDLIYFNKENNIDFKKTYNKILSTIKEEGGMSSLVFMVGIIRVI